MADREILSALDVAILGKIAAVAFDDGVLADSSPAVIDVARRCWLAQQDGMVLAVGLTLGDVLTDNGSSTGGGDR